MNRFLVLFCLLIFSVKGEGAEVLGIGSPVVDHLFHVEDDFLGHIPTQKGGGCRMEWEDFSKILKLAPTTTPLVATGGSCSNTLKGLSCLGVSTSLFGKLGNDPMGKYYLEKVTPLGIEPLFIITPTPTSQVICLVTPDKNRTFVLYPGAGDEITEEHLVDEIFEGIRHLHVEGYMLCNGQIIEESMKRAKAMGATISFDLGTFMLVEKYKDLILHLLSSYVDIVFANQDEAFALTGEVEEAACKKLLPFCKTVVVLAGPEGCYTGSSEGILNEKPSKVEVVDTTGAGDLFASGFLYGFLKGCSLQKCSQLGNLLGSRVVMCDGAEIPSETWAEIKAYL